MKSLRIGVFFIAPLLSSFLNGCGIAIAPLDEEHVLMGSKLAATLTVNGTASPTPLGLQAPSNQMNIAWTSTQASECGLTLVSPGGNATVLDAKSVSGTTVFLAIVPGVFHLNLACHDTAGNTVSATVPVSVVDKISAVLSGSLTVNGSILPAPVSITAPGNVMNIVWSSTLATSCKVQVVAPSGVATQIAPSSNSDDALSGSTKFLPIVAGLFHVTLVCVDSKNKTVSVSVPVVAEATNSAQLSAKLKVNGSVTPPSVTINYPNNILDIVWSSTSAARCKVNLMSPSGTDTMLAPMSDSDAALSGENTFLVGVPGNFEVTLTCLDPYQNSVQVKVPVTATK